MSVATKSWVVGQTQAPLPPQVKGLPLLGIAHRLRYDPLRFFVQQYHTHGSIFRTRILNRPITVMAGIEANHFLNTDGNALLSSKELFGGFAREMNTDVFLTAMDGAEHQHLRKAMRSGYARSAMLPHTDALLQIVDDYTRTLRSGDRIQVLPAIQRLVMQQLGLVMADRSPGDYFPDLRRFMTFILNVKVLKTWPAILLKLPAYQRAKTRVLELAAQVLAAHQAKHLIEGDPRNLIDDMLLAHDLNGDPYDEDALLATVIGPYVAGMDTIASTIGFFLYAVLKHDSLRQAITTEAEQFFRQGSIDLHQLKDMEMLHGAAIETLRMYSVTPFTPRTTTAPFEFSGYRVDAGTEIFFAQTVTHFLPEYYPDPYTFDPTRFAKGQGKGVPLAFAPFTLGAHLCLGAGIAETQMMLIMARLLHNLRLELEHPDVTIHATPLPNPGREFYVRVVDVKN